MFLWIIFINDETDKQIELETMVCADEKVTQFVDEAVYAGQSTPLTSSIVMCCG